MFRPTLALLAIGAAAIGLLAARPSPTVAGHSWNGYHWARTSNPFTLMVGNNVSSAWHAYLKEAIADWSASSVLDLNEVAGGTRPRQCRPTAGRIEVCADRYGLNGWLGLAQIWVSGAHITQATAKMNDSYFNTATYNTPAWRRLVMCQELAHDFGLDHRDENFDNPNLGTCMDYTRNPAGPPINEHPNEGDYDQLRCIYDPTVTAPLTSSNHSCGATGHVDSATTVGQLPPGPGRGAAPSSPFDDEGPNDPPQFGRPVGPRDSYGRDILYVLDVPGGRKLFTWVFWALPGSPGAPPARVR